jgi:hypothetical protein
MAAFDGRPTMVVALPDMDLNHERMRVGRLDEGSHTPGQTLHAIIKKRTKHRFFINDAYLGRRFTLSLTARVVEFI